MTAIIDQHKAAIIQIATPYSFGTGFYLKKYDIIVTNEHIVRDADNVVVVGFGFEKQLVRVLFWDAKLDLAFLEGPKGGDLWRIELNTQPLEINAKILAMGHPFGNSFACETGVISNLEYEQEDVFYWQHDAMLSPGNSGGPLFDANGKVVAINTFMIRDGENFGFSLPAAILEKSLMAFEEAGRLIGSNCYQCGHLVTENNLTKNRCPSCKSSVVLPSSVESYEAFGIPKTIEDIIKSTGHDVELSRRGPNHWAVEQGSATIDIAYYEKKGLITGDAYLCHLPADNGKESEAILSKMYQYLLEQNYQIEGLNFSVKGNDVVLSLLIYDRYLNANTGVKLFKHLFERADHYDNILVEKYGGTWRV